MKSFLLVLIIAVLLLPASVNAENETVPPETELVTAYIKDKDFTFTDEKHILTFYTGIRMSSFLKSKKNLIAYATFSGGGHQKRTRLQSSAW